MDTISTIIEIGPSILAIRLTPDGVIHETLTFKDDRLANFALRFVGDGHRSRPCWGTGGDQRLSQLSIGTKGSLLCVEVV